MYRFDEYVGGGDAGEEVSIVSKDKEKKEINHDELRFKQSIKILTCHVYPSTNR